jgi:hypothetical protein
MWSSAIAQAMICQFAIFTNDQLIKLFKTKTVNPGKEGKRISFVKKKDAPP